MPSIRKQKTQKRSRQQKLRRIVSSKSQPYDRKKLEEKKQQLEQERQLLEERLESLNKTEPVSGENLDYNLFDNGGGCGGFKKKKQGNKHSRQSRRILINPDTLTETDKQIEVLDTNNEDLTNLDKTYSADDLSQQGGCGLKKNMRPYTKSAEEKEEMRKIINQGLSSGELKLGPIGPNGNQMVVNAQNGGGKAKQQRPVSLRTAVKLLKNYYTKHN